VLIADPEWTTQRPGRSALLQSLATAILAEGEPAKVGILRTLAVTESPQTAWRSGSILTGIKKGVPLGPTPAAADARALTATEELLVADGQKLYQQLCAGCHGLDGRGVKPMAPPLLQSDWVLGSEGRMIRIALQGMTGPVTVTGTAYQPPNILPEMPGLAVLDDAQIASVLSYIRRAWYHGATPVSPEQVAAVRDETQEKRVPWTESQLRAVE
jgi:mono/diheme cytochrome c family protein